MIGTGTVKQCKLLSKSNPLCASADLAPKAPSKRNSRSDCFKIYKKFFFNIYYILYILSGENYWWSPSWNSLRTISLEGWLFLDPSRRAIKGHASRPLFPTKSIQYGGLRDEQAKTIETGRITSSLLKLF